MRRFLDNSNPDATFRRYLLTNVVSNRKAGMSKLTNIARAAQPQCLGEWWRKRTS